MLKVLLKKQIAEVFKSYFYDAKKNKMRSKWAIAAWIVFFVVIMVGVLGGMFTVLSLSLCSPLSAVGMGWLFYLLMGLISIFLGAFGSVFNTYAGIYLAKDNDLLFSLPIPARTIMAARLLNVYLMGAMYASVALLPALIVGWIVGGVTAARLICGLLLLLIVTGVVMLLSCLLGWVVAKVSQRLKNKSVVTVLLSLLFIAAYYFFYFKAADLIRQLVQNAVFYGKKIQGAAYALYLFGRVGEGDWLAAALSLGVTALLLALLWALMARSFMKIASASGGSVKQRYVEKRVKQKSPFGALLGKELARFTSSANYMLNCGLGVLMIPIVGVVLLVKGQMIVSVLDDVFSSRPGFTTVLLCTMLCALSAMINIAAPSVSLEGRSLWIPQSLPIEPRTALRAKLSLALLFTLGPLLFTSVCALFVVEMSGAAKLLLVLTPLCYGSFTTLLDMLLAVKMPLLHWTNETAPIKQSGAVVISIFTGFGLSAAFIGLYLLIGYKLGTALYMLCWAVPLAIGALLLLRWVDTRGARQFAAL